MKQSIRIIIMTALAVCVLTTVASARWAVEWDSVEVNDPVEDYQFGMTVYHDADLNQFSVPTVVRNIDGDAFWDGALPYDTGGFATNHPYQQGVEWSWANAWAFLAEEVRPMDLELWETLNEGQRCDPIADTLYNGESPDLFVVNAGGAAVSHPAQPDGLEVLTLTFDIAGTGGAFVFDTACYSLANNTIFMVDDVFPPTDHGPEGENEATFQRGYVRILVDTDGDGVYDHEDNCVFTPNPNQLDGDDDEVGDVCDNCPEEFNQEQVDGDGDGIGDACDGCPEDPNPDHQLPGECVSGILETEDQAPQDFSLHQNYPNPFNANTVIEFSLNVGGQTRVEVFDILGRKVSTLVDGYVTAGVHQVAWNGETDRGRENSSGIYFYRLTSGDFVKMRKMVLMK